MILRSSIPYESVTRFLNKEIPYVMTPIRVLAVSSLIASLFLFMIFFLGASETDVYDAPFRTLRLSGYALCIILPFFLFYGIELKIFRKLGQWKLLYEWFSKLFLIFVIFSSAYFYNVWIVNEVVPTWYNYGYFMLYYALPYLPLLLPVAFILYRRYIKMDESEVDQKQFEKRYIIKGRNQRESIELTETEFVFAEAQQNYITIAFLQDGELNKKVIRATLKEVHDQIPFAERVHRSFLLNPGYLEKTEGNARKKVGVLSIDDITIPLSPSADLKELTGQN